MLYSTPRATATLLSFNYGKVHISAKNVKYIESVYGNYSLVKFTDRKQIVSAYTLNHYLEMLDISDGFFNIHKGILINLDFLEKIEKRTDGSYALMTDGSNFRMSRRKGRDLINFLKTTVSTKTSLRKKYSLESAA